LHGEFDLNRRPIHDCRNGEGVEETHDDWQQQVLHGGQQVLHCGGQQVLHEFGQTAALLVVGTRRGCGEAADEPSLSSDLPADFCTTADLSAGLTAGLSATFVSVCGFGSVAGTFDLPALAVGISGSGGSGLDMDALADVAGSGGDLGCAVGVAVNWGSGAGCDAVDDVGGRGCTRFDSGFLAGALALPAVCGGVGEPGGGLLSALQWKMRVNIVCPFCSPSPDDVELTMVIISPVSTACT
jgi:hypothetical protein